MGPEPLGLKDELDIGLSGQLTLPPRKRKQPSGKPTIISNPLVTTHPLQPQLLSTGGNHGYPNTTTTPMPGKNR